MAPLAVEDANAEVRQWLARYGKYLDYQGGRLVDGQWVKEEAPEKNLAARLRNDLDPFVRACLHENPAAFGFPLGVLGDWEGRFFREASHLERLAAMRNPKISDLLVQEVLDFHETKLGITRREREELVRAFLANPKVPERWSKRSRSSHWRQWGYTGDPTSEGPPASLEGSYLWELIAKWPEDAAGMKHAVFSALPNAWDRKKAEVYAACADRFLRAAILETSTPDDSEHVKACLKNPFLRAATLESLEEDEAVKAGLTDADDQCRAMAYARVRRLEGPALEEVLKGQDKAALFGLYENRDVEWKVRQRAAKRLDELGASPYSKPPAYSSRVPDYDYVREIEEEAKAPPLPAELARVFDPDFWRGDHPPSLEEKLDVVGRHLVRGVVQINDRLEGLTGRLVHRLEPELRQRWTVGLAILGSLLYLIAIQVGAFTLKNMMGLALIRGALALCTWLDRWLNRKTGHA